MEEYFCETKRSPIVFIGYKFKKVRRLVRKRTIPTDGQLLVGEVSANISARGLSLGQRNASPRP
jgi:hypothetical protein